MTGFEQDRGSSDAVLTEWPGAISVFTINRPARCNAIDSETAELIAAAMAELNDERELAVGVLTGSAGCFSAGMDIRAFASGVRPVAAERGFAGFVECPPEKPLIAAVERWALEGGLEMVLACDMVVAAVGAQFGLSEVSRGLAPRGGGVFQLSRWLPKTIAMEMVLTGRPVSATRAAEYGLVNRVVPDGSALSAACELAEVVALNGPLAVLASKQAMIMSVDWPVADCFRRQAEYFDPVFASTDTAEGAAAFREQRRPRWSGR